jgi:putative ABC transport system substrate-binding protein
MKRRQVMRALAGAPWAAPFAAPLAVRAERRYRIGYLSLGSPALESARFEAFQRGLAALGYVEGGNLDIVTRWLDGRPYALLDEMARELVALEPDAIVTYTTPGVQAAKRATATIPIVFLSVGDAVALGLVASLARPGGNVTGTSYFLPELAAKRVELLKEAMPGLTTMGVLFNPSNSSAGAILAATRTAAGKLKVGLVDAEARTAEDLAAAVAVLAEKGAGAFTVNEDPILIYGAAATAALAGKHRLGSCGFPELAEAGGLLGYGIDLFELWRRGALFLDKIFKGAKPADIPVEQATKFVLTANLRTARALGVALPLSLTARADSTID